MPAILKSSSRAAEPRRPRSADLDPTAVDHLLGYLLALAEVPTRRAFQQHVGQPFDLRPVEFSLLVLLLANGQAAPKQIGRVLRLPAPHVTTLVNKLVERGLVERGRDPHDGRAVCVTLSAPGQVLAEQLRDVSLTMESSVQAVLTPAERTTLKRLLQKLARAPG
jgi:DNA-binding MarR family transcriptional regulator